MKKKYTLGCKIGHGGFGRIYKIENSNVPLVGKVIPNYYFDSIEREVKAMKKLDDIEGVINLIDVVKDENNTTIILPEYKEDLFSYITSNKYKLNDSDFSCKILNELLRITEECHNKGVLHLDIKPENIMIDIIDNDVKLTLIDFGSSIIVKDVNAITKLPHVCGTSRYSPIEIMSYPPSASCKSDMWSVMMTVATCYDPHYYYEIYKGEPSPACGTLKTLFNNTPVSHNDRYSPAVMKNLIQENYEWETSFMCKFGFVGALCFNRCKFHK